MNNDPQKKRSNSLFDSTEFRSFLTSTLPGQDSTMFKSKDSFAGLFESKDSLSDVFKSKDSFSGLFGSREWSMSYWATKKAPSNKHDDDDDSVAAQKTFEDTTQDEDEQLKPAAIPDKATMAPRFTKEPKPVPSDVMKSGDWLSQKTLGTHVEIPYTEAMFSRERGISNVAFTDGKDGNLSPIDGKLSPAEIPTVKTQWNELFMNQLLPPSSSPTTSQVSAEALAHDVALLEDSMVKAETFFVDQSDDKIVLPSTSPSSLSSKQTETLVPEATKKKRKRAPRKKIIPKNKVYVGEPKELDILNGRGGRSNHHIGNKRYREEVENLKEWYNNINSKDSKTDLSQCLVDYVQSYGARFLEKDEHGWYIVDNIVARRKASQALREDTDPEKRRQKRRRFLAKRAREQEEACRQGQGHG